MGKNSLSREQIKFLILLGSPALGMGLVYNLVTTYLPYFIEKLSGTAITGLMIGGEGIFALAIPFIIGLWSDSVATKYGKRLPFFFAGVLIVSVVVLTMPFNSKDLTFLGVELFIFFIGYYILYQAYYTFFPDLVSEKERGRSIGIQGGFRALGLLLAMVGGGVLIHIWMPLPFLLFTVFLILVAAIFSIGIFKRVKPSKKSEKIDWYSQWNLVRKNEKIKFWIASNIFWESAVAALRVFVVLYFTRGLSFSLPQTSAALGLVGIAAILAAPIAGKLADTYGHEPVILGSVLFFALGLLPPLFTVDIYFVACIVPVAFSAIILMTLPFSMLMGYLPQEKQHGAGAALYGFCQGVGALVGPLVAGFLVEIFKDCHFLVFARSKGYSAIFLAASVFLFASIPFSIRLFRVPD